MSWNKAKLFFFQFKAILMIIAYLMRQKDALPGVKRVRLTTVLFPGKILFP